jgi:hypothetical protein
MERDLSGEFFCPTCDRSEQPTIIYADGPPTPSLGYRQDSEHVVGQSIFESDLRLEPPPPEPSPGPERVPGTRPLEGPVREEALFLPRCRSCRRPLEVEEIPEGECRRCQRRRGFIRAGDEEEATLRPASFLTGSFAVLASSWAGALFIIRAAQSNPDSWGPAEFGLAGARGALLVFALAASIAWIRGRDWAAGAALALGTTAAALAAMELRCGAPGGNLQAASAWLLAGLAGALAALAAVLAGGAGGREETGEPASRPRVVAGGALALAAAAASGWQALGGPLLPAPAAAELLRTAGLGTAALAWAAVGVWLLLRPPAGGTHPGAIAAAAVGGAVPAWLVAGFRASGGPIAGALTPACGLARLLDLEAGKDLTDLSPSFAHGAAAGAALSVALVMSLWVLAGKSPDRGRPLAGFALSWVLVWGLGTGVAFLGHVLR